MKRSIKRIICMLLVLAFCSAGVPCFAAKNNKVYVALGDSIADGIGLPANPISGTDQEYKALAYCNKTEGSYPVLIAEKLGIKDKNFYQLGCAGMRTVELRYCLDKNYKIPNNATYDFDKDQLEKYVLSRYDYVELVSKADIITMNMCANDIAGHALYVVRQAMLRYGVAMDIIDAIIDSDIKNGNCYCALGKLLEYASHSWMYKRIINIAIAALSEGYIRWTENWDAICKRIYELNPDVTLICLGLYNPFSDVTYSDKTLLKIGKALDALVVSIDSFAAVGSMYSDRYTYVSIFGIESMYTEKNKSFTDDDFLKNLELNAHPSAKGHEQIANRVVNCITDYPVYVPEESSSTEKPSKPKEPDKPKKEPISPIRKAIKSSVQSITQISIDININITKLHSTYIK